MSPRLSLFGYDPLEVYTGRAPLETAAMGLQLGPDDWAIRCNLVTIVDGQMRDFTAGHISNEDGKALIEALQTESRRPASYRRADAPDCRAGVSRRCELPQPPRLSQYRPGPVHG